MDGNFKAQRMKVSSLNNEVNLIDGEGYFVKSGPYQEHLVTAKDISEVSISYRAKTFLILISSDTNM